MKASKLYFPVVLFIMLFKVAPAFESLDEILRCDLVWISYKIPWKCDYSWHFNWEVLRSTLQDGILYSWLCGWNPRAKCLWPLKWKPLSSTFLSYYFLCSTRWFLLESVKIYCYVDFHLKEIHSLSRSSHPCQNSDARRSRQLYENKAYKKISRFSNTLIKIGRSFHFKK